MCRSVWCQAWRGSESTKTQWQTWMDFFNKISNKKNPCLQKDWSRWSRNLKALAQTCRTCISKEALQHTDPWAGGSGALCMAALTGDGEKRWLLLSCGSQKWNWEESQQFCLEKVQESSKWLSFYPEWKWEGKAVPGFSWGCSLQVWPLWSMASWALVFAELERGLK